MKRPLRLLSILLLLASPLATAGTVKVAVAANFIKPMRAIAAAFERDNGHRVQLAAGSSGKLYAQIRHGAPFDLFLSADADKPARLASEGLAVPGSRFTYALGALVLWSADPGLVDDAGTVLRQGRFEHLALANPKLAPYGAAARATLQRLGLWEALKPRMVFGENIAQTYQFVHSGNAQLGFVARAQVMADGRLSAGSAWPVPQTMHPPIRQDAVLLDRGRDNPAATALLAYLRSAPVRALIRSHGYALPAEDAAA